MLLTWIAVALAGFGIAVTASRWAVQHAAMLAHGLSIPPFLIGVTFFALGTDVPEIANSVMASLAGHGDLNVGDSVGSVVTQITLILGILPFAGGRFSVSAGRAMTVPALTVVALGLGALLVSDGYLSRMDGLVFIVCWIIATAVTWRYVQPHSEAVLPRPTRRKTFHLMIAAGSLLLVAAGAAAAVKALVEVSAAAGIPEYTISFFGSSIGTSLPEIVVTITALRQGQKDLALGDIFGACLMDSTLSIGAGPLIAPTAVTAAHAVRGAYLAVAAMVAASGLIHMRREHDRFSGFALLMMYAAAYWIL